MSLPRRKSAETLTPPTPPTNCDSCGKTNGPLEWRVIEGNSVQLCVEPTACLDRAGVVRQSRSARS